MTETFFSSWSFLCGHYWRSGWSNPVTSTIDPSFQHNNQASPQIFSHEPPSKKKDHLVHIHLATGQKNVTFFILGCIFQPKEVRFLTPASWIEKLSFRHSHAKNSSTFVVRFSCKKQKNLPSQKTSTTTTTTCIINLVDSSAIDDRLLDYTQKKSTPKTTVKKCVFFFGFMTYLGPLCHQDAMSKPNNPAQRVTDREATKRKHLENICKGDTKYKQFRRGCGYVCIYIYVA